MFARFLKCLLLFVKLSLFLNLKGDRKKRDKERQLLLLQYLESDNYIGEAI